ncbi:MAG: DUF6263 family protein [Planctomycetota bacterium]
MKFSTSRLCSLFSAQVSFAATIVLFVFAQSTANAQTAQWKFNEGDQFSVTMTQSSEITSNLTLADVDDQDKIGRTARSELILDMDWQVTAIEDGNAIVEQTISRIRVVADTGSASEDEISIDTSSDDPLRGIAGSLRTQMKSLIGLAFDVTMSPRGEVIDVTVSDETQEALRAIPGSMQIRQMMTAESMADLYGQAVVVLPEDSLEEGQPWETSAQIGTAMGAVSRTNRYTFAGMQEVDGRSLASFDVVTTLEPVATEGETPESRLVDFEGGGTMMMDLEAGHFVSSTASNVMNTEREYFDKTIVTTVSSDVEMQIEKK